MAKKANIAWPRYCLALAVALLYNDWLLGPLLNPRMSTTRSLISELSARTQPYHWVFQSTDIFCGLLIIACVGYIGRLTEGDTFRNQWLLTGLFLVIGVDNVVDAMLPISCAPSVDPQCNLFATHSLLTSAHLLESNIAGTLIAIAPLVWWRYHRNKEYHFIAEASLWLVVFESFIGIDALIIRFSHHGSYGFIQRAYELALGTWVGAMVYIAAGYKVPAKERKHSDHELVSSNDAAVSS